MEFLGWAICCQALLSLLWLDDAQQRFAASELTSEIEAAANAKGPWWLRPGIWGSELHLQSEASWNDSCVKLHDETQFQMTQNFFEIATMNVHDDYLLGTATAVMTTNFFAWKVYANAEYDADRFCFLIAAAVHCQACHVGSLLPSHTCSAFHQFHRPLQVSDESDNPIALIIKPRNSRIASKTACTAWNYPNMFRSLNSTPVASCGFQCWYSMQVNKVLQRSASLLSTHLVGKKIEFDFAPLKLQAVPVKENFECYGGGWLWHPYRRDFGIHHYDWWTPPLPNEFSKGCSME